MRLYGLKTCDTCRKALRSLENIEFCDLRTEGVPDDVLARALALFGPALVNTRSTTWRGLDAQDRARDPLQLLKDYPALMKRPLIVDGPGMYLGWGPEVRARLLQLARESLI